MIIFIQNLIQCFYPNYDVLRGALIETVNERIYYKLYLNHNCILSLLVTCICFWGDTSYINRSSRFKLELWICIPLTFNDVARYICTSSVVYLAMYNNNNKAVTKQKLQEGDTIFIKHKQPIIIL